MPDTPSTASWPTAARTQLAELRFAKSTRRLLVLGALLLVGAAVLRMLNGLDSFGAAALTTQALLWGPALGALLVADVVVRAPAAQRTLLHMLLAPVTRTSLYLGRLGVVAIFVGTGAALVVGALHALSGQGGLGTLQYAWGALLGGLAYSALAGLLFVWIRWGFFVGLLIIMGDVPLSQIPFALRNLSISAHVQIAAGRDPSAAASFLGVNFDGGSPWLSSVVLLAVFIVASLLAAARFRRMPLPELC